MVRTSGRTMEENVICVEKKKKKRKKIELRDVISRRKKVIFERHDILPDQLTNLLYSFARKIRRYFVEIKYTNVWKRMG